MNGIALASPRHRASSSFAPSSMEGQSGVEGGVVRAGRQQHGRLEKKER